MAVEDRDEYGKQEEEGEKKGRRGVKGAGLGGMWREKEQEEEE